mgnify:CR=1 FL=1
MIAPSQAGTLAALPLRATIWPSSKWMWMGWSQPPPPLASVHCSVVLAVLRPGAAEMRSHKAEIEYTFERTANGGIVRIVASKEPALTAVHEFLRYQIREHATGDPLTIRK